MASLASTGVSAEAEGHRAIERIANIFAAAETHNQGIRAITDAVIAEIERAEHRLAEGQSNLTTLGDRTSAHFVELGKTLAATELTSGYRLPPRRNALPRTTEA